MQGAAKAWQWSGRRRIAQWFRYADEEIKQRAGDFRRVPYPGKASSKMDRDAKALRASAAKDEEMVRSRIAGVGFEGGRGASIESVSWVGSGDERSSVAVIWDVHNKPEGMCPLAAAKRVINIASVFGNVVDRSAYVSRRMLCFLPLYTREYNRAKTLKVVDGELVGEKFVCGICKRRLGSHTALIIHFKKVHEALRTEQIYTMHNSRDEEERRGLKNLLLYNEKRYQQAARSALTPKVLLPDGLPVALVRAGFFVRQMHDKPPKAPDIAAWTHICQVANLGIGCICFVCDSSNYTGAFDFARRMNSHTVLIGVGHRGDIKRKANLSMTWEDVVTGRGMALAEQTAAAWAASTEAAQEDEGSGRSTKRRRPYAVEEDDMFFEYYDDLYPSSEYSSQEEDEE